MKNMHESATLLITVAQMPKWSTLHFYCCTWHNAMRSTYFIVVAHGIMQCAAALSCCCAWHNAMRRTYFIVAAHGIMPILLL